MKILIADGPHKNCIFDIKNPMPVMLFADRGAYSPTCGKDIEYKVAYKSVDNECAIFNLSGKSSDMIGEHTFFDKEPFYK